MATCTHVSIHLARFDEMQSLGDVDTSCGAGSPLLWAVGADERAAGHDAGAGRAFALVGLGLHPDEASARAVFDAGDAGAPFVDGAVETWAGVFQPYNHRGAANWLDREVPGPVFATGEPAAEGEPFAVLTSVGWTLDERFDLDKAMDFSVGVGRVRNSMDAIDGLHSQQSFNFPGTIAIDPITFTFWRDDAAVRAFAYRPGEHKSQMDRYRQLGTADRTSFTRLRAVQTRGTWYGVDPLAG